MLLSADHYTLNAISQTLFFWEDTEMKWAISILTVATITLIVANAEALDCQSNMECPGDEYCSKAEGNCFGHGTCSPRPELCPMVWDPVCGCDGVTYGNECLAANAGINIQYKGQCLPPSQCIENSDCQTGEYCSKAEGDCVGLGACTEKPAECPDVWDPVCGCDDMTYGNSCEAAAAGVNIDYTGECLPPQCTDNSDCQMTEYCEKDEGNCDGQGSCELRPGICPMYYDPVCGCDGLTYGNSCEAAAAGVSVKYDGECKLPPSCTNNNQCAGDSYCSKDQGDCDGIGSCETRPLGCPDVWDPVCGCDGMTYGNSCEAAAAGVNIDYIGECLPPCTNNNDCPAASYCAKDEGNCDGMGMCTDKPDLCPLFYDPVCGCDGQTYGNSCEAAAAGVNVEYKGECKVPPSCTNNNQCTTDSYCSKAEGDCDGHGICSEKPVACPEIWDPVCGCDGRTYGNSCEAAAAGVNVKYKGECLSPCTNNNDCAASDYCSKAEGDCDGRGTCNTRPIACPRIWDPVCGCDGRTYGNSCEAAAAGVSVEYDGECKLPGPTVVMLEPRVADDDVHTGPSGLNSLRILWSEPIIFTSSDITIVNEDNAPVGFTALGNNTEITTIMFRQKLLHDIYTITVADSAISASTGRQIDGNDNGTAGGDFVFDMEHRRRSDFNNNNQIKFPDLAFFAEDWLAKLE